MKSKPSHNTMILSWMRMHPETGITSYEAFRLIGCTRLAARISELRAQGNNIVSRDETREGVRYSRYVLVP